MEDENNFFKNLQNLQWWIFLRVTILMLIAGSFTFNFYKWRNFVSIVDKIPHLKYRFYHILGHAQIRIYNRLYRLETMLPHHVYDFLLFTGYCHLHGKDGIALAWACIYPTVFLFKADAVEVILNHSTQLKKAWAYKFTHPWFGLGLLTSDGTKWKNRRKLLTPAFHFNILKDFLSVMNSKAKIFVDILNNHTTDEFVDIVPLVTRCSLDIICDSLLGVDLHVQTNPSNPYVKSVNFLTGAIIERLVSPLIWPDLIFNISSLGRQFQRHKQLVQDFTLNLIKDKKAKLMTKCSTATTVVSDKSDEMTRKKRALLDLLLDEHINNNSLSERDILEEIDTFTFEGHDTTAMAISWSLYMLGLHPGVQEKAREELDSIFGESDRDVTMEDLKDIKYLECVIKETLRLFPSVPMYGRQLTEDVEIQGHVVPKGSTCVILDFVLHRDPEFFPNPEKFDPNRFLPENSTGRHPFCYTPFSAGPRNCIGQRFAFMELKVIISSILRKFRIQSLDPRDKVHLVNEMVLRPLNGLRLKIRNRDQIPENPPVYYYYP